MSNLVFEPLKDRICEVSGGLHEEGILLTTCYRMDQIINTLCLYAIESGLLTRFVCTFRYHQVHVSIVTLSSSLATVASFGCVRDEISSLE